MNIEQLRDISPQTIQSIATQGHTSPLAVGLSDADVEYIIQLNRASELLRDKEHTDGSQLSVARVLQQEFPLLSLRTARRRVSDCIEYLYSDNDITAEDWHSFYADKMDMLAKEAETNGDIEAARRCYQQAHEYRVMAAAGKVAPERVRFKRILVSPDVDADRMGLGGSGMRELLQQAKQLINTANIPQREKERLEEEVILETGES